MNEEKLRILHEEVEKITKQITEHNEEIIRLNVIRDILQGDIELYEPINLNGNGLPF